MRPCLTVPYLGTGPPGCTGLLPQPANRRDFLAALPASNFRLCPRCGVATTPALPSRQGTLPVCPSTSYCESGGSRNPVNSMSSLKQIEANRPNAQHSIGPRFPRPLAPEIGFVPSTSLEPPPAAIAPPSSLASATPAAIRQPSPHPR